MKILKAFGLIVAGLVTLSVLFATAGADGPTLTARILPQTGDTASVLLAKPGPGQTILIRNITAFYENAANTSPFNVGIQVASFTRTRYLWLGQPLVASVPGTFQYQNLNVKIPGDSARVGVLLFITAASSDTLSAYCEYEIITGD